MADKINKTLLNKSRKSVCKEDGVFYNVYKALENRNEIWDNKETRLPFYTPFVEQKKDIDRSLTLYIINAPFQLFHADVADIRFSSKSAVDPKYALICVDLFFPKVYVYPMKNKSNLAKKLQLFYEEIDPKEQEENENLRLQTDLEFQQKEIKRLNNKYNVEMFSSKVRGGKAFAAESSKNFFSKAKNYTKQAKKVG